jgi:uncharacterized membrane protein (UPF0127 family)
MHKNKYCVYNTTRETFLSLGVHAADTAFTRLKGLIGRLKLAADDGLWVVPSRGVHTIGVTFPLDLIYLDADSRVIHILESFPQFHIAPLITQSASVLQLPTHTIYSSHTQVGDQMLICMANEMENRLTMDTKPAMEKSKVNEEEVPVLRRNAVGRWWSNLFSRDRRRADRLATRNLTAYFWNGGRAEPHEVRDISSTGLYLRTEERWYPGTVVKMTLQDNDPNIPVTGQTITLESMAVRSGEDGTGLKFVLSDTEDGQLTPNALLDEADTNTLKRFLERFQSK